MLDDTGKTNHKEDLSMNLSKSDRRKSHAEQLNRAKDKLRISQFAQQVHNLHNMVRALALDIGSFWYDNKFESHQRIAGVLTEFFDNEGITSITLTDPNLSVNTDGFVVKPDGSQHEDYRTPIYETGEDGIKNTLVGYKPIDAKHHTQVTIIGANIGNSVDGFVQELFGRAKLRGISVNQLDCTRLDGSVVTIITTIKYDEAVGYYKRLSIEAVGTLIDGLSHKVYSMDELTSTKADKTICYIELTKRAR